MLRKYVLVAAMVMFPLAGAQPARGQAAAPPDTTGDAATAPRLSFSPAFSSRSRANQTSISLEGEFRNTLEMNNGVRLLTNMGAMKEDFRLRTSTNENKRLQNQLYKQLTTGWTASLTHSDSRVFNRVVSLRGGTQDIVLNTLRLGAGLQYVTMESDNFRWDGRLNTTLEDAEKTFKTDKAMGGDVAGGVGYNLLGERIVVRGRGYYKRLDVTSESIFKKFEGLGLEEDSVSATVEVNFSEEQRFKFDYADFGGEEKFTDQRRGSLGGQKEGAENLYTERRIYDSRVLKCNFVSHLFETFDMKINAEHSESVTDYDSTKTRFTRNVTDYLRGELNYTVFTGTAFTARLDVTESLRDLGPQSVSSFDQRQKKLDLNARHQFEGGFSVNVSASASLTQSFYLRYEDNPRDRDQLDQRLDVRIGSTPFDKLRINVNMTLLKTDFVNIDRSLSSDNRVKTRYDLSPVLFYSLTDRINIEQNYGLAIEFTDHTFIPEDNYLDRNISFSNRIDMQLSQRLKGSFFYAYYFHDRGSYLPDENEEGGERYLSIERNDRRDETRIKFEYDISKHVSVIGEQDYARREDKTIGSNRVSITEDGGIKLGLRGSYNWATDRTLSFSVQKANEFGKFSTDAQKDYWLVDAQLKYAF